MTTSERNGGSDGMPGAPVPAAIRYETFLEELAVAFAVFDRASTLLWANRAFALLSGRTIEACSGCSLASLCLGPAIVPLLREVADGRCREVQEEIEVACPPPSGRRVCRVGVRAIDIDGGDMFGLWIVDLTEHCRAERLLRQLVENVPDYAIYTLDDRGRVSSWNAGAQRLTGYCAQEIIGRSHAIFYTQEEILLGQPEQALKVARERGHYEDEHWRVRKDGTRLWTSITVTRMQDGQSASFSKIVRDMTENKLIEEALRESNHRLVATLESISDGFCAFDREGVFTLVNPEAERLLRKQRADLLGRHLFDVFPGIDQAPFIPLVERALRANEKAEFEAISTSQGQWFEVRAYPSPLGLSVYFRDVSARQRAQLEQRLVEKTSKELAESLDYRTTLQRVVRVMVPDFADGCVLFAKDGEAGGESFIEHVDVDMRSLIGDLMRRFPPRSEVDRGFAKALHTGEPQLIGELTEALRRQYAQNDEHFEMLRSLVGLSAIIVPLRARGRTLGGIAFLRSAKGPRYREEDLLLAKELARRAALAMDNARLYQESQVAIRAREDMVAIATHDLRGPITTLKLSLHTLLQQAREGVNLDSCAGIAEKLAGMERQVDRLARLVTLFLDISQVAAGQPALQLESFDVVPLMRELVERLHEQLEEAGCMLHLETEPSLMGRWDRVRLEQIVGNLLGNAMKFGRGRPIELALRRTEDDAVEIRVTDQGVGVPPEEHEQIFQRFRRAPASRDFPGAGLGLYIVRRLAEAMGGSIRVESQAEKGASFVVRLPLEGHRC